MLVNGKTVLLNICYGKAKGVGDAEYDCLSSNFNVDRHGTLYCSACHKKWVAKELVRVNSQRRKEDFKREDKL